MDESKIAFITCVNDEQEYQEACWYIHQLEIPSGYCIDIIAVRNAGSMTEGYQAAMQDSDAKYKVYLHQDVFILNRYFLENMLKVFSEDKMIGMIGCIGCETLPLHAQAVVAWDIGVVYHNSIPHYFVKHQDPDGHSYYVEALDGMMLITQYDVNWRTDLFDQWDFYDISQCFEMQRAGYKVVVPYQDVPWCYHDNGYSKMRAYYDACKKFIEEYQDRKPFRSVDVSESKNHFDNLKEQSRQNIKNLINCGRKEEVRQLFRKEENQGFLHLREFETFVRISDAEAKDGKEKFWDESDTYMILFEKLREIKFVLIRAEYTEVDVKTYLNNLYRKYSINAIEIVRMMYQLGTKKQS